MTGRCLLIVFLSVFFASRAFCGAMNAGDTRDTRVLHKKDSGETVRVQAGDTIRIELDMLGSAGYDWYIERIDAEYVELLSEGIADVVGEKAGGHVTKVWLFRAKKSGTRTIFPARACSSSSR